jgi:putative tryptophan/tyrosine transport system substrate-binding protein
MRRREFIAGLGSTAAWPVVARAQQPAMPVIGVLNSASSANYVPMMAAFHRGLREAGYVEGRNVAIEYRWANEQSDRLPALTAELVQRQVKVIVAGGALSSPLAAKAATATIPIVFSAGVDPVESGLVASLNRPGGNVTGVTNINNELLSKRLQLLHELLSAAKSIALLVNPTNPGNRTLPTEFERAAQTLGLQAHILNASTERELETAFATMAELRTAGMVLTPDPFFIVRNELLAALALRHAVPTVSTYREFAAAGGLMSYGGSVLEMYRLVGFYTGRILKGDKPADLPVQQATRIELVINMKTAKALGLTIPETLLATADEVIQ